MTHVYADAPNAYSISATATDVDNSIFASNTFGVTVNNVTPTLAISGAGSSYLGSTYTLALTSSDPGTDSISQWSVNWGDGNIQTVTGNPSSVTHIYTGSSRTVSITATAADEDGTYPANTVSVQILGVPAVISSGMVAWWKGDGNFNDAIGGDTASPGGPVQFVPGEVNQAFIISNDDISAPSTPSLSMSSALSIDTWVHLNGYSGNTGLVYKGALKHSLGDPNPIDLGDYDLGIAPSGDTSIDRLSFQLNNDSGDLVGGTNLVVGQWYHVAATFDGTQMKLYVNGVLDGVQNYTSFISTSNNPVYIGVRVGDWFGSSFALNGDLDETSIYNRALTQAEVQSIYNAGAYGKALTTPNIAPTVAPVLLSIVEGGTVVLNSSLLQTTDPDNTPLQLTYTATNVSHGRFALVSSPAAPITSFTQAQINSGAVEFVHDGSELAPTFQLQVSDRTNTSAVVTPTVTFTNVNNHIPVVTTDLTVTQGGTHILTTAEFNATDADLPGDPLSFSVTGLTHGYFAYTFSPANSIASFSLADVGAGRVIFVDDQSRFSPRFTVTAYDGINGSSSNPSAGQSSFTATDPTTTLTITVTNTNDSGQGSLRQAILDANNQP